jgi:hypothetical protein
MTEFNETILNAMVELEGYTFEEAKLSYAQRANLPNEAFCGPNRTYPAHDAAHVRNGLSRLGTFGGRLKKAVRDRILACLKRRAKTYGIEVSETIDGKLCLAKWDETIPLETRQKMLQEINEITDWFMLKNSGR